MANIIPFPRRRATGSWDADMRSASSLAEQRAQAHKARLASHKTQADHKAPSDCGDLSDVVHTVEFDTAFLETIGYMSKGDDNADSEESE